MLLNEGLIIIRQNWQRIGMIQCLGLFVGVVLNSSVYYSTSFFIRIAFISLVHPSIFLPFPLSFFSFSVFILPPFGTLVFSSSLPSILLILLLRLPISTASLPPFFIQLFIFAHVVHSFFLFLLFFTSTCRLL